MATERDFSEIDIRKLPKAERPKPTTGQSSEPFQLPLDGMNAHEQAVVRAANKPGAGRREVYDVSKLARSSRRTLLQTRNAIRRLIPSGWLEKVETIEGEDGEERRVKGHYRITKGGRERLAAAAK